MVPADGAGDVGDFEPAGDFEMPADMDPFDTGNPDFASPEMTEARAEANDAVEIDGNGDPVIAADFGGGEIAGDPVDAFEGNHDHGPEGEGGDPGAAIGDAAQGAFTEAIEGGATTEEAMEAAQGAAQEVATELGIPQEEFEALDTWS